MNEPMTETSAEEYWRKADETAKNWLALIRVELQEGKPK